MQVHKTDIPGVLIVEPKRHGDTRGFFTESWNRKTLADAGIEVDFVQDNMSLSADPGTLRGMHYQAPPHAQTKLVSCLRGKVLDVVLDVRRGSPTYGQHFSIDLSFENGRQLLVPKGLLHGFVTKAPDSIVFYKVDAHYNAKADGSVAWDSCGIDWGLEGPPVLSAKDIDAPTLDDFESPFEWSAS